MAFWGVEVKCGKPVTLNCDGEKGRLRLSQATLGFSSTSPIKKSVVQCNVGDRPGVLLCSLLPGRKETCSLNLIFNEDEEVVFSVLGPSSVHLTGYYMPQNEGKGLYDSDTSGEDITGDSEDFSDDTCDDDYEEDFIDDEDIMLHSRVSNSGVKIEEIEDEDSEERPKEVLKKRKKKSLPGTEEKSGSKPAEDGMKNESDEKAAEEENQGGSESEDEYSEERAKEVLKKKKKKSLPGTEKESGSKPAEDGMKNESDEKPAEEENQGGSESEDEDGFPMPTKRKNKENGVTEPPKKKQMIEDVAVASDPTEQTAKDTSNETKKAKKKKKKTKAKKGDAKEMEVNNVTPDKVNNVSVEKSEKLLEENEHGNNIRTFPNGLVIEELSMGKPDGRKAVPGNKVSMYYTGKLKKNGKIFDSNIGRKPFQFRLGIGEVISGWDVGVKGMRVGDKRRLTIPPAMGYGAKGAGEIPGNAWLVFDVELVNVK